MNINLNEYLRVLKDDSSNHKDTCLELLERCQVFINKINELGDENRQLKEQLYVIKTDINRFVTKRGNKITFNVLDSSLLYRPFQIISDHLAKLTEKKNDLEKKSFNKLYGKLTHEHRTRLIFHSRDRFRYVHLKRKWSEGERLFIKVLLKKQGPLAPLIYRTLLLKQKGKTQAEIAKIRKTKPSLVMSEICTFASMINSYKNLDKTLSIFQRNN